MADGQPDWLHLVEVDHDPFAGAPVTLQEVDHDPFAQPQAPPMTAQQRYRAAQYGDESRMPQYQRTGPSLVDVPGAVGEGMADTARMMTTPLPPMPRGSYMDVGGPQPGTADPQEYANWLGEIRQRGDLAPSMALGMIGGGSPFAVRGALGAAGGKLIQPFAQAAERFTGEPIRAYHGSPHDFERFDLSKIGTGEGAQAYGHGLYFAENEGVARNYRDVLGRGPIDRTVAALVRRAGGDWGKARTEFMSAVGNEKPTPEIQKIIDGLAAGPPGHMYEVGIRARPEDFLDWDRPLREQSPHIQSVMERAGVNAPTGKDIYQSLIKYLPGQGGGMTSAGMRLSDLEQTPRYASGRLNASGIPGIRYLDQGSRTAGEGSRNYVMFNADLIDILRKYGIVGPAAIGGALAAQDKYQEAM